MRFNDFVRGRRTSLLGVAAGVFLTAATLTLSVGAPVAAWAQDGETVYRLGPEDKIRLKVFEWRPSQDEIFEWKALNDEFTVNAAGMLSVPLAGEIPVRGMPLDEVAHAIAERLRQRMNLTSPPYAAVDMVQYRPFYVAGDVIHPGPFPYHPGLTVLDAVATAGGVIRASDLGMIRIGREAISGEGELDQLAQQRDSLLVRRARLQAEAKGEHAFTNPPEIEGSSGRPDVSRLIQNETRILEARDHAFKTQSDALQELKVFLNKETDSLSAQLSTIDTQMQLINKELVGVTSLVEKGMAVAPRQLALERSVAQVQGDRLSMETNKLRVLEEISKTDIALVQLRDNRITDASIELRDTQVKLDEVASKSETTLKLLFETKVTAPGLVTGRLRKGAMAPTYVVVRPGDDQTGERTISENAIVQPGDTVKVKLPDLNELLEPSDAAASLSPPRSLQ